VEQQDNVHKYSIPGEHNRAGMSGHACRSSSLRQV